ncbi:transcription factor bHLH157-like [Primulina huaijiensis]|uniref:transcription factor bHLH157-like n=1 Tax=Primulina huaijiensis TaxID=1492673 RepID=UPI003CC709C2
MGAQKIDSNAKETLKNLCCSNGWSYALFWGFDYTNSLLLTLKDAYYEEQLGAVIDNMMLQVHVFGGGVIGQAAFTKNDRWMFSEDHNERQSSLGSFQSLDVFQDDSELYCQFSMGIETIALISVEPLGVVQFGSTHKILETKDFAEQVKELFRVMGEGQKFQLAENETASSKTQFHEPTTQFLSSLSHNILHSTNQNILHDTISEGFRDLNNPMVASSQLDNLILESGNIFNAPVTKELSSNSECSVITSSWSHLTSKLSENADFSSLNANVDSASTSSLKQDFSEEFIHSRYCALLLDSTNCGIQRPSSLMSLEELFQDNDFEDLSKYFPGDDLAQWFSSMPGQNNTSFPALLSSDLRGCNLPIDIPEKLEGNSLSSITDTFGTDHVKETQQDWSEPLIPIVDCDDLNFGADDTKSISEKYVHSDVGTTSNSLFSKLGLDLILDGCAGNSYTFSQSRFDIQSSSPAKRRKIESYLLGHDQVKYQDSPIFDEKLLNSAASLKEPGVCIGNRCSLSTQNSCVSKSQDELKKSGKKKAKTGTKPRPKDRQMIQDRLVELRGLIPNGEKMSIDRLLERTIRHLNFMSGLIKHAETLKQIDKPKSGAVPKDNFNSCGGGGITWACEVGEQMMVCPLKVEDLSTPGQMLIEIQCEEQGFFLEIADLIRGFGLIILKGVLKVVESNIWAHFIVEAEENQHVTRHEVFSSLIQLLQMSCQSAGNANDPLGRVISSGVSLFNHHKPTVSFPVNLIS